MRLLAPPRAWPSLGLLLFTLLLGAVCGVPVQESQSPEAQPGNPLGKAQSQLSAYVTIRLPLYGQGNVQTGKDKQPDEQARHGPTPDTPSSLVAEGSDPEHVEHGQEENGAKENSGMSHEEYPEPNFHLLFTDLEVCETSVLCKSGFLILYVNYVEQDLPSCPCTYPVRARQGVVSLLDEHQRATFHWMDVSLPEEFPHNSSAHFCLYSLLSNKSSILASQHCCYDAQGLLLTRGDGAGTPELISPELFTNPNLSLDHLPWNQCKEEWAQHHVMMPPNNGLSCPENPPREENPSKEQNPIVA